MVNMIWINLIMVLCLSGVCTAENIPLVEEQGFLIDVIKDKSPKLCGNITYEIITEWVTVSKTIPVSNCLLCANFFYITCNQEGTEYLVTYLNITYNEKGNKFEIDRKQTNTPVQIKSKTCDEFTQNLSNIGLVN